MKAVVTHLTCFTRAGYVSFSATYGSRRKARLAGRWMVGQGYAHSYLLRKAAPSDLQIPAETGYN